MMNLPIFVVDIPPEKTAVAGLISEESLVLKRRTFMMNLYESKISMKKEKYVPFALFLTILITGLVIYAPCLWGNKVLVYDDWGYDTYNQYLPAYDFFKNIFSNSNFSNYFFSYGLGSGIFVSISWIADIFTFPAVVFCSIFKNIEMGSILVYLQLTKCIVGGMLCFVFLRLRKHKLYGAFVGAYIFSFCGYFFVAGQHYFFATYLVYYIGLLVSIELARNNKKYLLLITGIAFLVSIHSAYASFHIFMAAAVYVCFCSVKQWDDIKKIVIQIVCFGWHIFLGLLAGMIVFLPLLFEIMGNSTRVQTDSFLGRILSSFSWADESVVKTALLRLMGNNLQGGVDNWTGVHFHFDAFPYTFSALFLIFFFTFTIKIFIEKCGRKEKILKISIVLCVLFLIFNNFIPSMFNVFQGPSYRFVFVFIPLFASIVSEEIDAIIEQENTRYYKICLAICLVIGLGIAITMTKQDMDKQKILEYIIVFGSFFAGTIVLFAICLKKNRLTKACKCILLGVLAINLICDDGMSLYYERDIMSKDEIKENYYNNELESFYDYSSQQEGNNFYRIDRTFEDTVPDSLYSLRVPSRTVSMYNSIIGSGLTNFFNHFVMKFTTTESTMATMQYRDGSFGNIFDNVNADILGLKYVVSDIQRYDDENWGCVYSKDNKYLYQNKRIDSAGLLYENIITKSTYEGLSEIEKAFVLSNCIVVEDSEEAKKKEIKSVPYYEQQDAVINVCDDESDTEKLEWNGTVTNETKKVNVSFDGTIMKSNQNNKILSVDINTDTQFIVKVGYMIGGEYQTIDNGNYINRRIIPVGNWTIYFPVPNDAEELQMEFECVDQVENNVQMNNFKVYTSDIQYSNSGIKIQNPNYGNTVVGEVEVQEDSYLLVPIVKEDGWKLYVDGNETKVDEADYCFCIVKLSAGKHDIQFTYENKYYDFGKIISMCALVIIVIEILFMLKRNKRADKSS